MCNKTNIKLNTLTFLPPSHPGIYQHFEGYKKDKDFKVGFHISDIEGSNITKCDNVNVQRLTPK